MGFSPVALFSLHASSAVKAEIALGCCCLLLSAAAAERGGICEENMFKVLQQPEDRCWFVCRSPGAGQAGSEPSNKNLFFSLLYCYYFEEYMQSISLDRVVPTFPRGRLDGCYWCYLDALFFMLCCRGGSQLLRSLTASLLLLVLRSSYLSVCTGYTSLENTSSLRQRKN